MVAYAEVFPYLETLDFPAGKEEILREAARLGAPEKVLRALRALPAVEYGNRDEVLRSSGTDAAPEVSDADQAAKTRDRVHQDVSVFVRRG
jgi:hypothetical protein